MCGFGLDVHPASAVEVVVVDQIPGEQVVLQGVGWFGRVCFGDGEKKAQVEIDSCFVDWFGNAFEEFYPGAAAPFAQLEAFEDFLKTRLDLSPLSSPVGNQRCVNQYVEER